VSQPSLLIIYSSCVLCMQCFLNNNRRRECQYFVLFHFWEQINFAETVLFLSRLLLSLLLRGLIIVRLYTYCYCVDRSCAAAVIFKLKNHRSLSYYNVCDCLWEYFAKLTSACVTRIFTQKKKKNYTSRQIILLYTLY
jgi:hypothetical protein